MEGSDTFAYFALEGGVTMHGIAAGLARASPISAYFWLFLALCLISLVMLALAVRGAKRTRLQALALQDALDRVAAGETGVRLSHPATGDRFDAMATAVEEREQRLFALAWFDADTALFNQRGLEEIVRAGLEERDGPLTIVAVGVDRFTQIQATIGRALANDLVRELGRRIAPQALDGVVARLSPSLLGFALPEAGDPALSESLAAIRAALLRPVEVASHKIDVDVTAGHVSPPRDADPRDAIERAMVAITQARGARLPVAAFNPDAYGDPAGRLELMRQMHIGFDNGEITVHYQPKLTVRTGEIGSAEALIRWRHPIHGAVPPDQFVAVAEETGDIRALTIWMLHTVMVEQERLIAEGFDIAIYVNISARLLGDKSFAREVLDVIGADTARIGFEITETAVIEDPEDALANLQMFADAGVKIAIDDYGSGMSSLAYLKQLPAHELKIDKMFVGDLTRGHREPLLVRSTIDLAHALGMVVTAEGVESPSALALLKVMGCDLIQGHIVAKPMPIADLSAYLASDVKMQAPAEGLPTITPLEGYW